jgi:hypothetical protein
MDGDFYVKHTSGSNGKGPKRLYGNIERVKVREDGQKRHRREVLEWEDLGGGGHDGMDGYDHDL